MAAPPWSAYTASAPYWQSFATRTQAQASGRLAGATCTGHCVLPSQPQGALARKQADAEHGGVAKEDTRHEERRRRHVQDRDRQERMAQALVAELSDDESVFWDDNVGGPATLLTLPPANVSIRTSTHGTIASVDEQSCWRAPIHVVFVVDASGSMRLDDVESPEHATGIRRCDAVMQVLEEFIDAQHSSEMASADRYSMISFNRTASTHFRRQTAPAAKSLLTKLADRNEPQSVTCYLAALKAIVSLSRDDSGRPTDRAVDCWGTNQIISIPKELCKVVFLSDGRPGDATPMLKFFQEKVCPSDPLRGAGFIEFHTVGFGDLGDFVCLQQMSAIGRGTFQLAGRSLRALQTAFTSIGSSPTWQHGHSPGQAAQGGGASNVEFEPPRLVRDSLRTKGALVMECIRRTYAFDGCGFVETDMARSQVLCRPNPWTQGSMHFIHAMQDDSLTFYDPVDKRLCPTHMVAKVRKSDLQNAWARTYVENAAVTRWFAKMFCRRLGCRRALATVLCYLYESHRPVLGGTCAGDAASSIPSHFAHGFAAERHIHGTFQKFNNNRGHVDVDAEGSHVAQAFSHFTYELTKGNLMAVDIQGVCHAGTSAQGRLSSDGTKALSTDLGVRDARHIPFLLVSDAQVLSRGGQRYGPADLGVAGMAAFFRTHRCNSICHAAGLSCYGDGQARGRGVGSELGFSGGATSGFLDSISDGAFDGTNSFVSDMQALEDASREAPGVVEESLGDTSVFDAIEHVLEEGNREDLADKFFIRLASASTKRSALRLFHLHYHIDETQRWRQRKFGGEEKIIRRLELLLS